MDVRTTRTGRLWRDDEGIVHFVAAGEASTSDSSVENMAVVRELTAGGKAPILFDIRGWSAGDPGFWLQFVNTIESVCLAGAVVVDSDAVEKLGAFPASIDSMLMPFRVFSEEEMALAFLRAHLPD